jgi:hypothetical protein
MAQGQKQYIISRSRLALMDVREAEYNRFPVSRNNSLPSTRAYMELTLKNPFRKAHEKPCIKAIYEQILKKPLH